MNDSKKTHSVPDMSAILDEIISLTSLRAPRDGDFTALDYLSHLKSTQNTTVSTSAARSRLMKLVEQDVLSTCIGLVNGKRTRLWWKKEEIKYQPPPITSDDPWIDKDTILISPPPDTTTEILDTNTYTHATPPITLTE